MKRARLLVLLVALAVPFAASGETETPVRASAERWFYETISSFNATQQRCEEAERTNQIPIGAVRAISPEGDGLKVILMYKHARAHLVCSERDLGTHMVALATYLSLVREDQVLSEALQGWMEVAVAPAERFLKAKTRFEQLSPEVRKAADSVSQLDQPFDLIGVAQELGL